MGGSLPADRRRRGAWTPTYPFGGGLPPVNVLCWKEKEIKETSGYRDGAPGARWAAWWSACCVSGGSVMRRFSLLVLTASLSGGLALAQGDELPNLPIPEGPVVLEIHGKVGRTNENGAAYFDMAMLEALPAAHIETSTAVTDGVHRFDGFLVRDLLAHVKAYGKTVEATALNHYAIDFDIGEFDRFDVIAAYAMDGEILLPSDKGPLWIVYPRDQYEVLQDIRYDYSWIWQLVRFDIR